jgi:hypothetical protein
MGFLALRPRLATGVPFSEWSETLMPFFKHLIEFPAPPSDLREAFARSRRALPSTPPTDAA